MRIDLMVIVGIASALAFGSCVSKQQPVAGAGDYEYQQWLSQKRASLQAPVHSSESDAPTQGQPSARRPKASLREANPTIEYALTESNHLRSFGSSTGFVERAVFDEAIIAAQEQMSVLLRSELQSVAQDYVRNANINLDNTSATLYESVTNRFAINVSKNSKIAKHSVYDLDNGQLTVYICIESRLDTETLSDDLANELGREGFLGLQFDRDRFAKQTQASLQDYSERLNAASAKSLESNK